MSGVSPGSIANRMPPAEDDQARRARDLARTQREQSAARSLEATSIGEGGLRVIGGTIEIEAGGQLKVDGDATFNGNLTVPAGSLNTAGNITAGGQVEASNIVGTGGGTFGGTLEAGAFHASGNADVDGTLNVDGPIFTPHGRANPVVTSYVAAYINSDGRLGATPSSRRFKQQITAWSFEWQALFAVELFEFKYNAAVDELGDMAPTEVGLMAEDLDALGLTWLVVYDEEGAPWAVAYEKFALVLLPVVQDHERRLRALEGLLQPPSAE